jgi:hypothetical protein
MNNLKHTSGLVKALLEQDEQLRNSDSLLYLRVLSVVADRKGIDLRNVSIPQFLLELHGTAFPPFESVRRSRQKVQELYPELRPCAAVADFRQEEELNYRAFARCEV